MTVAATQCTQPGCGGTIDGGYCSVCGMAAAPASAPASAIPAAPASCTQPGCGGTIDGGYCTVCGMAAASAPVPGHHGRPGPGLVPGLGGDGRQRGHPWHARQHRPVVPGEPGGGPGGDPAGPRP